MRTCPLYTNKKVRDEINEIVTSLGGTPLTLEEFKDSSKRSTRTGIDRSAAVAAYKVWDYTQGNGILRAPNG
jgi:hypothetical protein